MPLLIDGHNLIGQMATIRLGDDDDELQLVQLLRLYRNRRADERIVVIFDGGVPNHPARLDGYGIETEFALTPNNADQLLIQRISSLSTPNRWQLVTSDREVVRAARRRGMTVISAQEFGRRLDVLHGLPMLPKPNPDAKPRLKVDEHELDEWLELFGIDPADAERVDLPYEIPGQQIKPSKRKRRKR